MTRFSPLALIVAWSRGRVIGKDGGLPWYEPADLAHFKRTTMGHALLMGRRTHASIGRALPGRRNLVISTTPGYAACGCEVFPSFEAALEAARETDPCPMVIGGAALYRAALPLITRMHVTEIDLELPGDVYFPAYDEAAFVETARLNSPDGRLVFRTLERREAGPAP